MRSGGIKAFAHGSTPRLSDPLLTPTVPLPRREGTITLLIMALVFASSLLWYIII